MELFNRDEVVTRTTGVGYIDDNEQYIAGTTTTVNIECSIQPYREGKNSFNNPTGYRTIDAIKVYSKQPLLAADEFSNTVGDQLTYNGKEYFCKDLEIWTPQTLGIGGVSLIPEHYLGYFYRKDKA